MKYDTLLNLIKNLNLDFQIKHKEKRSLDPTIYYLSGAVLSNYSGIKIIF